MQDFLFQIPWWVPANLIAAGAGIWVWGNNRVRKKDRRLGLGLILLAVGLSVLSYLVDTPCETVERLTRELVTAVVDRSESRIGAMLHSNAIAYNWNRQDIIFGAIYYAQETGLKSARIMSLRVEKRGQDVDSYLTIWSDHTGGNEFPVTNLDSQWKLIWTRQGKVWRLIEIIPLRIADIPRERIEQRYLDQPVQQR